MVDGTLIEKLAIAEAALLRIKEDAEYCYGKPYDYTARLGEIAKSAIAAMKRESAALTSVIRLDEDGEVDDVAIAGDLFRMERMNDGDWWVCIYRGDKRTVFSLTANCNNNCLLSEDSIGCHDDTKTATQPQPPEKEP